MGFQIKFSPFGKFLQYRAIFSGQLLKSGRGMGCGGEVGGGLGKTAPRKIARSR